MEFVGSILQIVEFISAPIGKCWKYCRGLDKNKEILKSDLEELNSRKEDVESRLSADLQSGKKLRKKEVEDWLKNVEKINIETQDIEKQVGEKRCLSRACLGKLVDEKIQEVKELYEKGRFPDGVVVDAPPSSGITLPTTTLVGETTAKKYMSEILEYLMGDEIRKIGVCGMGGIGKTTIMKHINNQLRREAKKFDDVIWVTVSKELDVIKLQNDIACVLNLELPKCDDKTIRAGGLFGMLERKKRYVLILDDMWEAFSLEDVGIPEPTSTNGCKLVLTTRSLDVCHYIDCKVVEVGVLTAILLRRCFKLKYVPSLARLKALRKLDLMYSGIEEVPQGMKMLVNLRCLYLGGIPSISEPNGSHLKMLPTGILPKLSRLQCLIVAQSPSKTLNVKAEEVGSLRKLETFVGNFYDLHDFNVYARRMLQGQGPHKYLLQVGSNGVLESKFDEEDGLFSRRRYKCVVLTECNISSGKGEDALVLPNDIEYLSIQRCHDVSNLSHASSLNTNFLKECHIIRCDEIECVLSTTSSSSSSSHTPLQSVEVLHLSNLQNLRVLIFRGEGDSPPPPPLPGAFSNLKTLNISFCPNIKKLFTLELLPNLEELDVRWCGQMEEIIAAKALGEEGQQGKMCRSSNYSTVNNDDDAVFTITLPKLACLRLWDLRELKSIVSGRGVMICDSLQTIYLHGCPKLKRLPLSLPMRNGQPSPPPSLQRIEIDRVCWHSLEWDHPTSKDVLQSFISKG